MADTTEYELLVVCEDEFAASLISQMLPKVLRRRVAIKSCGAKTELALQAQSHLRLSERSKCLILWDGDVSDTEAQGYVRDARARFPHPTAERRLSWARLPGTSCPELWALEVARNDGLAQVAMHFNFDSAEEAGAALGRCGLADVHSIPYELAQQVGLPESVAANGLAVCVARTASAAGNGLVGVVQGVLDGTVIAGGQV